MLSTIGGHHSVPCFTETGYSNVLPGGAPETNLSSDMLVHWVKVIWTKDGGSMGLGLIILEPMMGTHNNLFTH